MAKCGMCVHFGECPHVNEKDDVCRCFYPDVYMEVSHPKKWREREQYLNEDSSLEN